MNWHTRYLQQAAWTRDLRNYLFDQAGLKTAQHVLEVGCGTGAILCDLTTPAARHGLDIEPAALDEYRIHASAVSLTRGDGHHLPYPDKYFDITYCHYLLLWVHDPLQVVREMARVSHCVLALAEPDYSQRVDEPFALKPLGRWQTESLRRQGANPFFGAGLAETFYQAGINLIETGPIQGQVVMRSAEDWENEWAVLKSDLEGIASGEEIQKMQVLDEIARKNGERTLHVPTYFAWGKT
ncbi:MAG: class I SAM-dependent methyltransferase [Anaerolineales bacterium]|uniref:class I SAM-dependent methyltransferase n=1 Tax=Candidatus Villigracilis proximus TaxID=3140683 RepID=UPI0031356B15|nr:class I SAM-dependent methyltransferase [Anaerolineales bacterium]